MTRVRNLLSRLRRRLHRPSWRPTWRLPALHLPAGLHRPTLRMPGALRASPRRRATLALPAALLVLVIALLLVLPGTIGSADRGVAQSATGSVGATATASPDTTWGPLAAVDTVAAPTPTPAPTPDLSGYVWPLRNARVTLPFGPTHWGEFVVNGKLFHDGLDMATQCGDKVLAAHDGVVLAAGRHFDDFVGWQGDLALYYDHLDKHHSWSSLPIVIVIADSNGLRSIYAHESRVLVQPGQQVKAGQVIGIEGQTGHATGCHVHFGLFDPSETKSFDLNKETRSRLSLPKSESARINPLLALPYRHEISEMRALRPQDEAAWRTAHATPAPTPTPAPVTPYPY